MAIKAGNGIGNATTIGLKKLGLENTGVSTKSASSGGGSSRSTGTANDAVTWTSSNKAIATIAADGTITALKSGTVTITVADGNRYQAEKAAK